MGHRSAFVPHSIGLAHLAVLTANPGQEIPAIDLAAGVAAVGQAGDLGGVSAPPYLRSRSSTSA